MEKSHVTIQIPMKHRRLLELLAREEGESFSTIVRRLLRDEGVRRGLWNDSATAEDTAQEARP